MVPDSNQFFFLGEFSGARVKPSLQGKVASNLYGDVPDCEIYNCTMSRDIRGPVEERKPGRQSPKAPRGGGEARQGQGREPRVGFRMQGGRGRRV